MDTVIERREVSPLILEYLAGQGVTAPGPFPLAGSAGSGRLYYRIAQGERSWILVKAPQVDKDFLRLVDYTRFFCGLDLPVPDILRLDEGCAQMLQEDLGTVHLLDIARFGQGVHQAYRSVIEALIQFQQSATPMAERCAALASWQFDFKGLRWETSYFTENYVIPHLHPTADSLSSLSRCFDSLAHRVAGHPRVVMHRDFQSQNILIRKGRVGIIDFQGARMGSPFYDLASLLWDPYTELPLDLVEKELAYFVANAKLGFDSSAARIMFIETSLQRLMQACGAYCFLSQTKNIASFAQYLAPGLRRLNQVLSLANAPHLAELRVQLSSMLPK